MQPTTLPTVSAPRVHQADATPLPSPSQARPTPWQPRFRRGLLLPALLLTGWVAFAPAQDAQCSRPTEGLISWWSGDGDARDRVSGFDAIPQGGAAFASGWVSSSGGSSFQFDGIDDYLAVPGSPALSLSAAYTFEAWVQSTGPLADYRVLAIRGSGSNHDIDIYIQKNSNDLIVAHNRGNGGVFQFVGFEDPPANVFFHLAVTWDGTEVRAFYDGIEAGTTQRTRFVGAPLSANIGWEFGRTEHSAFSGLGRYTGLIDEISIYDRALDVAAIQAIHAAGREGKCKDYDGDGLTDDHEAVLGTNPFEPDTDSDGLSDGDEIDIYLTHPLAEDTDGDGLLDGVEIDMQEFGCPNPLAFDTDLDGLSDGMELDAGFDLCDDADFDGDGLMDGQEILDYGTDPYIPDSDGDGLMDGTEVDMGQGTGCPNPLHPDSDADGILDGDEVDSQLGSPALTDPCSADTDGDSIPDAIDPLPTDPTGTEGYVATDIRSLCGYVETCSLTAFLAPNNNAAKGRRNATCNKLNAAANAVSSGDYQKALDQLTALRLKLDELASPKDWMVPGTPEIEFIRNSVDENVLLIGYL